MISASEWKAYNDGISRISDAAEKETERRLLVWHTLNPDATVAEAREYAKEVMAAVVQSYDSVAASFAAKWYDYRAERGGARLDQAVTSAVYSPETADAVARYQAKKLVKGDFEGFAKSCGEYARNDALRSLNETIMANAKRDRRKGVRFARVPTGSETCTFCLMLASHGAVYHTRKTAGEFKHFHRSCDCKVVPGFEDDPDAELVEGYKPKELRAAWRSFKEIEAYGLSKAQENALKMASYRSFKLANYGEVAYADVLNSAMCEAAKEFRAGGKTVDSYEATVNRFVRLLGEQVGVKASGSWAVNSKGKPIFAVPDGNELWVMMVAMKPGEEVKLLPQERDIVPDVKTAGGYAEFKTPKSVGKVASRLTHAAEQISAREDQAGTVYLSFLRLDGDEDKAISIAQRFVDDETIQNLCVIHADGTTRTLKKKDAGLGS